MIQLFTIWLHLLIDRSRLLLEEDNCSSGRPLVAMAQEIDHRPLFSYDVCPALVHLVTIAAKSINDSATVLFLPGAPQRSRTAMR